jgi:hypothetical protein
MIHFYLVLKLKSRWESGNRKVRAVLCDRNSSRRIFILGGKSWKKNH